MTVMEMKMMNEEMSKIQKAIIKEYGSMENFYKKVKELNPFIKEKESKEDEQRIKTKTE